MAENLPKLAIVVPCYYEEEILPKTLQVIGGLLTEMIKCKEVSRDSVVCLVNDGSQDKTWELIQQPRQKIRFFTVSVYRAILGIKKQLLRGCMNARLIYM